MAARDWFTYKVVVVSRIQGDLRPTAANWHKKIGWSYQGFNMFYNLSAVTWQRPSCSNIFEAAKSRS